MQYLVVKTTAARSFLEKRFFTQTGTKGLKQTQKNKYENSSIPIVLMRGMRHVLPYFLDPRTKLLVYSRQAFGKDFVQLQSEQWRAV